MTQELNYFLIDNWWEVTNDYVKKTFNFDNYITGLEFAFKAWNEAENLDHHPSIIIDYKKVTITSTTHESQNKVTEKDMELAYHIEQIYNKYFAKK